MNAGLSTPELSLKQFFCEMHKWEVDSRVRSKRIASGELDPETSHNESRCALEDIFQRLAAVKCFERGIRFQHPPEYNPDTEAILSVRSPTPDTTEVFTEQTEGWNDRRKFTLVNLNGQWRIAKKHRINPNGREVEELL